MHVALALTIGLLSAAAIYMFLARDLPRVLVGFVLLGVAANLVILLSGRIGSMSPPLIDAAVGTLSAGAANPLPQALILTAIVIGFGLAAFTLMLIRRSYDAFASLRSEDMDAAEAIETSDTVAAREPTPARRKAA